MLIIRQADFQRVLEHCNAEYPSEACGILAGQGGSVRKVYAMTNAEPSPSFYMMDPAEQFSVMKDMREAGLDLVGIYHSHPGSPAYPSGTDVNLAYYPEAVYLIVSLREREKPQVRGFTIVEGAITEVAVSVTPEESG